jgi:tryptophan synthase beta chain
MQTDTTTQSFVHPDTEGYYGRFGGAYIPEMLHRNVRELREHYLPIIHSAEFRKEMESLLRDYVGRPTPLFLSERLSTELNTQLYLKREDLCHTGAHKINNTVGQILLARRLGKKRIIAETGAGQHGVATATVCALKGMECIVYMGEKDIQRQAPNVARMKMLGAKVIPAISGSRTLKDATNEAIRDWINHPNDTHYIIGSVVGPHPYPDLVARFQSVISEEIRLQLLDKTGSELPTHVVACVGGGSNAAGAFYHFLDEPSVKIVAVEAAGHGIHSGMSAATTQLGKPGILHGSMSLVMQTDDGQVTEPHSISAGLDYPGVGPIHANLYESGRGQFESATDAEALEWAFHVSKTEGIIPALETAHAFAVLPRLGLQPTDRVVVCLSGRGDKDLGTYMQELDRFA